MAEVSDPNARPKSPARTTGPLSGPVSVAANEFFLLDTGAQTPPELSSEKRKAPPKPKWEDPEPYVYSGPVSSPRLGAAWVATGATVVVGVIVVALVASDLSTAQDALKKAQTELATVTTTATAQSQQITVFEQARAAATAEQAARAREEQEAQAKVTALRDVLAEALRDEVAAGAITLAPDGRLLRVELQDRLLFERDGTTLTEEAHAAIAKLGAALKGGSGSIDVVGHIDPRRSSKKAEALTDGTWGLSAARATLVLRALEDDGGVRSKRLSVVARGANQPLTGNGSGKGRQKNRRVELLVTP